MNEKRDLLLGRFLFVFILMGFFLFVFVLIQRVFDRGSPGNHDLSDVTDPLKAELENSFLRHKNNEIPVVDLASVTTFSWDQLYMFGPYTQSSEIDEVVGRTWRENCYTDIAVSEGTLLVFTADGTAIHCMDYANDFGAFFIPESLWKTGISPGEALFILENEMIIWVGDKSP